MSPAALGWPGDAVHGGGGQPADAAAAADDGQAGAETGGESTREPWDPWSVNLLSRVRVDGRQCAGWAYIPMKMDVSSVKM